MEKNRCYLTFLSMKRLNVERNVKDFGEGDRTMEGRT